MSGRGGARPGSGPKPKYTGVDGQPLPTTRKRVPAILTDKDIQEAVWNKQRKNKSEGKQ